MNLKPHNLPYSILFVSIFLVPCLSTTWCNQTCGSKRVPFPFGFSPACNIQLNCTSNATVLVRDFPVQTITHDTIFINIPMSCSRPVEALRGLFTQNYAPLGLNTILLSKCRTNNSVCFIPTSTVRGFGIDCGEKSDRFSCYSEATDDATSFIDYKNLTMMGCRFLVTALFVLSDKMNVQQLRLRWWLQGECQCSKHARCVIVSLVNGNANGHRCECLEGYTGDGFLDGSGCRRDSRHCTVSRYISGECGGTGRIVILIGGLIAGVCFLIFIFICCIRRKAKMRKSRGSNSLQLYDTFGITVPIYLYKEMAEATDFFSEKRVLGNGAFGTVYSGKLANNKWVAIKRIRRREDDSIEQVINEVKILSSVSHPNLVQLLGCSLQMEEQILVFEFITNGTLFQHLHKERGSGLPWPVRLSIAAETAQAISYLHNEINPPIYHRDIKSSNILLDYSYKSKVSDFGLSRLGMVESSHISTNPRGTPGYIDPQYHRDFHLSDKSDVYSFGVVLCEIITGMKAVDFDRPIAEINLAALAVDRISRGRLNEIIDPLILEADQELPSVHRVAELAFKCLIFYRDMRPSMMEVSLELDQIKADNCSTP